MIVRSNKTYETHSLFPDTNFYENEPDNLIVDETTPEGQALAAKIEQLSPYMDFVLADGKLIDVTELPRAPAEPGEPTVEQRLAAAEAENAQLRQQMAQQNADFTAFQDFYFEKNPEQA